MKNILLSLKAVAGSIILYLGIALVDIPQGEDLLVRTLYGIRLIFLFLGVYLIASFERSISEELKSYKRKRETEREKARAIRRSCIP